MINIINNNTINNNINNIIDNMINETDTIMIE